MTVKSGAELIGVVEEIGRDARELPDVARDRALRKGTGATLSSSELRRIATLVERSEATVTAASELARARREEEIRQLQAQIDDIEASLAVPLDADTVDFLKRTRRKLRARLLDKQTRVALDFGGILSAAELNEVGELLAEAKQAVARRKRAAGFIKSLFRIADLAAGIVRKAGGIF
jgi:hypothetical protein